MPKGMEVRVLSRAPMSNPLQIYVVAGCVIKKDGKYLLVQEGKQEARGQWNLPAGRVEVGEFIKDAAIRETKEETGYNVEIIRELTVFHEDGEKAVKHIFEAKVISGELQFPQGEILDVRWLTIQEVEEKRKELRREWVIDLLKLV